MHRTVCAALLAMALAGSGSPSGGVTPQPIEQIATTSQMILQSSARTTAPPPAADGSNISACYDGECEIAVSKPVRIPLDGRSGFDAVAVEAIEPAKVRFHVAFPNGSGSGSASPGSTVTFNSGTGSIRITVIAIDSGTAVIKISPA